MTATATRPPSGAQPAPGQPGRPVVRVPGTRGGADLRRTLLALLASALGVVPLCELFSDRGWLVDVWLTMIVVVAPAAYLRRNRGPSAGQVWIGVLLLIPWLTVNFVREHAVLGIIPLRGAWHDVGALMTDLHDTTVHGVAPLHSTVAARLALCAALGLMAALVDLLAVVGRRGALAGIPLLVVFTVSGAVPREPVTWTYFVLAAIGFLILLALDSSDDLQRWGHFVPRAKQDGRTRAAGVFSAQRIAVVAIALAVAVPIFVPSDSRNFLADLFHDSGGGNNSGFGADQFAGLGTGGIDPFAALRGQLVRDKNVNLLKVKISSGSSVGRSGAVQPFYLRTNVLSSFQSDGWRAGARGSTEDVDTSSFASSPGTAFPPSVVHYLATITVDELRSNPPVFANPVRLKGVADSTQWSPQDQLLTGSQLTSGQVIAESVAQNQPSVAQLRAATGTDRSMRSWLTLPKLAPFVRQVTARVTKNATTPYEKARALTDYFGNPNNGFSYSLSTRVGDSGDDLTDFLRNKVGFCQQYAAAMAVMLRLSDVPARVVLGYAHDVPDTKGEFTVTTFDAHAWVEAYFAGVGWVPFDPTPLSGITDGSLNDLAWAPHDKATTGTDVPTVSTSANSSTVVPTSSSAAPAARGGGGGSSVSFTTPLIVLGAVVFVVAVLLVPAATRTLRRRRRRRQVTQGDTDAIWAELADTAVDLGYVWSSARTPRQVASWLQNSSDASSESLRALTAEVERARYSARPGPGGDLLDDLDSVLAGLQARRSPRERWRAKYWPASLGWSRAVLVGRLLPGRSSRRH